VTRVRGHGASQAYEIVHCGVSTPDREGESLVSRYATAGATWWLEIIEPRRAPLSALGERVDAGPPIGQRTALPSPTPERS
jgi:hypothetical protein